MLELDAPDAFDAYLVTGGLPLVCQEWEPRRSLESFLANPRRRCWSTRPSRERRYRIADPYLRFYLSFLSTAVSRSGVADGLPVQAVGPDELLSGWPASDADVR
ncbi:hypothetical protein [Gandjariella thermophila]|uniref:Uncharacterized protein n=1 Tax=Gandjariella thermophila TaxID=1931992 RepID=A0A4D4JBT6_9PSEU|nr:hypothetical protein [Gandjariella thermophila]GDY31839.1 hypothetical protein GTS_34720 [Gandjariella thermophila]